MTRHLSLDELRDGLDDIMQSPEDREFLKAIVIRRVTDQRLVAVGDSITKL
jgi:hypothetical protein